MIILASTSKYRKAQLESLGLTFECVNPEVDESAVKVDASLNIQQKAEKLALLKAQAVQKRFPDATVIGGDQIAAIGTETLSKPITFENNLEQLQKLNGKSHHLYTANVVLKDGKILTHTEVATLKMYQLTIEDLKSYIDFAKPFDCAGGYKIEVGGENLFESIVVTDPSSIQGMNLNFIKRALV
jgi:septum formation protein